MLTVDNVEAFYGKSQILRGVSLSVGPGEIVALLGRNGSGRSTLAKAIVGLVERRGSIRLGEDDIAGDKTFRIARRGVGYVPESRDVFPDLTVEENLRLGESRRVARVCWRQEDVFALFPRLEERLTVPAGVLSGGGAADADARPRFAGESRCSGHRRTDRRVGTESDRAAG